MGRKRKYDELVKAISKRPSIGVTPERAAAVEDQWSSILRNAAAMGMPPPVRSVDPFVENTDDGTCDYVGTKIAELDRWYREKEQHSESWYHVPTGDIERECIRKFDSSVGKEFIPSEVCAVCGQLASPMAIELLDKGSEKLQVLTTGGSDAPVLDPCGIDANGRTASVCSQCYAALSMKRLPTNAVANGFLFACPKLQPDYLQDLTAVEEMLIARARPYGSVIKLSRNGLGIAASSYFHTKGHFVVVPQVPDKLYDILPTLDALDNVKVIWVGSQSPDDLNLRRILRIRKRVVLQALIGLRLDNPLYRLVVIDEAKLSCWSDEFIPQQLLDEMTVMDSEGEDNERAEYVPAGGDSDDEEDHNPAQPTLDSDRLDTNAQASEALRGCTWAPVDGDIDQVGVSLVQGIRQAFFANDSSDDSGLQLEVRTGSTKINYYEDNNYFMASFPTLFPTGTGGHKEVRPRAVSPEVWGRSLLRHHNRSFARHKYFLFLLFDGIRKSRSHVARKILVRRDNWPAISARLDKITAEDLLRAEWSLKRREPIANRDVRALCGCFIEMGRRAPLSHVVRQDMRNSIKGLIVKYGQPSIWFTVNPGDSSNPLVCKVAGVEIPLTLSATEKALLRQTTASQDAVSVAIFFNLITRGFIDSIVQPKSQGSESGAFGKVDTYYAVTETNGRGMLHLHGLMWLVGNIGIQNIGESVRDPSRPHLAESVMDYISYVSRQDIDLDLRLPNKARSIFEHKFDWSNDSDSLSIESFKAEFDAVAHCTARKLNMHGSHTATCYKYRTGKQACRFGYPKALVSANHINEAGDMVLKRTNANINYWNASIAVSLRCNHDIKFLQGKAQSLALVYYCTNYATKMADPLYHSMAAVAAVKDSVDSTRSDEESTAGDRSRDFLIKAFNRIGIDRELSAVEIANYLLGYGESITDEKFVTLNVNAVCIAMKYRFPQLAAAIRVGEPMVTIRNGQPNEYLDDYRYRGDDLGNLNLYDYKSCIESVRKGSRSGWYDYDDDHRSSSTYAQAVRTDFAVVNLSGFWALGPNDDEEADTEEALAAVCLGLFVPWQRIDGSLQGSDSSFRMVLERLTPTLSPRTAFHMCNLSLLKRTKAEAVQAAKAFRNDLDLEPIPDLEVGDDYGSELDICVTVVPRDVRKALKLMLLEASKTHFGFAMDGEAELQTVVRHGDSGDAEPTLIPLGYVRSRQVDRGILERWHTWLNTDGTGTSADTVDSASENAGGPFPEYDAGVRLVLGTEDTSQMSSLAKEVADQHTLNDKQRAVLNLVAATIVKWIHRKDSNVVFEPLRLYVGGEGGTGKSRVIESISSLLEKLQWRHALQLCASTGAAADNIGGSTIHSALGLNTRTSVGGTRAVTAKQQLLWAAKEVLIIDEISMVSAQLLSKTERGCRRMRCDEQPWGGMMAVIVCGDFLQFPPVNAHPVWKPAKTNGKQLTVEEQQGIMIWHTFNSVIMLTEQMRQAEDVPFQQMLHRARDGNLTKADLATLNSKIARDFELSSETKLITRRNKIRHKANFVAALKEARRLRQDLFLFAAEHSSSSATLSSLLAVGDNSHGAPGPGILAYTRGMPVVLNQNINIGLGLVNGTEGVAVDVVLDPKSTIMEWPNSPDIKIVDRPPAALLMKLVNSPRSESYAEDLEPGLVPIFPVKSRNCIVPIGGVKRSQSKRTQLPISPAYCITNYKSQGRTFDKIIVDFEGDRVGTGQADYAAITVPLSRVRKLDGLSLAVRVRDEVFLQKPDAHLAAEMERLLGIEKETLRR